jgi:hypothetical protein
MKSIALTLLLIAMSLPFHAQLGIPCANISIPDSCGVLYTNKMDERCLLTFMKVAKQDSLISIQQQQIQRADSIIYTQLITINECDDELKRRRKNTFKAAIGGTVGGFLMGIAAFGLALLS